MDQERLYNIRNIKASRKETLEYLKDNKINQEQTQTFIDELKSNRLSNSFLTFISILLVAATLITTTISNIYSNETNLKSHSESIVLETKIFSSLSKKDQIKFGDEISKTLYEDRFNFYTAIIEIVIIVSLVIFIILVTVIVMGIQKYRKLRILYEYKRNLIKSKI